MSLQPRRLVIAVQTVLCGSALVLLSLGTQADSPFLRARAEQSADSTTKDAQLALGPRTVTVAPGSNVILELAIDHLNRIVTPFRQPSVRTVSSLSTEVDGNVLYVATAEETPATLYITDADDRRTTVALTLAPRRVPPREIHLQVPGLEKNRGGASQSTSAAPASASLADVPAVATWRQPQHYIDELTQHFRALALGEVPSGYRKGRARSGDGIRCGAGFRVSHIKSVDGDLLRFLTAKVRVTGQGTERFDESRCALRSGQAIAAVALWPSGKLNPGTQAELIVAIDPTRDSKTAGQGTSGRSH